MSWRKEILTALRTRLLTVSGVGSWPLITMNREPATRPAPTDQFMEDMLGGSSSDDAAIGNAVRWREIVGTWQLMLCVPVDTDVFPALGFADTLELAFLATPALVLTSGDTIRISSVLVGGPRPARPDDPWVRIPVVFKYTVTTHT